MRTANVGTSTGFVCVRLYCIRSRYVGWRVESGSGAELPEQQPPLQSSKSSERSCSTLSEGRQVLCLTLGVLAMLSLTLLVDYDYGQHDGTSPESEYENVGVLLPDLKGMKYLFWELTT